MSGLEAIEAPLLRPCFESLKRAAKERKTVVDEIEEMLKAFVADAEAVSTSGSTENARSTVDSLVTRLQGFKRKLQEVSASEAADASRCKARLEHLAQLGPLQRGHTLEWNKPRLERLIAEHLLRSGCPRAAKQLADAGNLHQLLDLHIFEATARIVESLRQHDCAPALAWCEENRAKLRKSKSRLEFDLRVQEFIELVRRDERMGAVAHARKHLAPWAEHYLGDLQRAMAALALTKHTRCTAYRDLFDDSRWSGLVDSFHADLFRLHSLTPESMLEVTLKAGLAALKTPEGLRPGANPEDPLQRPAFRTLAADLPFSKHVLSKLLCAVTGQVMSDANPPMVLPNGYVYSQQGIEQLQARSGDGTITCPKTGQTFSADELRRAYIV